MSLMKMILAWKKKVRLAHLYFKKKTFLEHLQKKKYNALYPNKKKTQTISIIPYKKNIIKIFRY